MKRIAFISDLHLAEEFPRSIGVDAHANFNWVLQDISRRNIDELIIGGDVGEAAALPEFFKQVNNYPVELILGNHDAYAVIRKHQQRSSASEDELYFSKEEEGHRLIFMDSSREIISADQLGWLRQQIETQKNIILFVHHPILPVSSPIDDKYPLQNRDTVLQTLKASGRPVSIICGHYHMEDHQEQGIIEQHISPAVSYRVVKEAKIIETAADIFGYTILNFTNGNVLFEVITNA